MVYAGSTELLMSLSKAVGRFANVSIIRVNGMKVRNTVIKIPSNLGTVTPMLLEGVHEQHLNLVRCRN